MQSTRCIRNRNLEKGRDTADDNDIFVHDRKK